MTINILAPEHHNLDNTARLTKGIPIPRDIMSNGVVAPSAEQLYYMARVLPESMHRNALALARVAIAAAVDGVEAKGLAHRMGDPDLGIPMIIDMPTKRAIMLDCVRAKFAQDDGLALELMNTNGEIAELNNWGDSDWGKILNEDGEWDGENYTGEILMLVRGEVRARYDAERNRFFGSEEDRQRTVESYVRSAFSFVESHSGN